MLTVSFGIMVLGYVAGALLLTKAARKRLFARFPFFYCYVTYTLASFLLVYALPWVMPELYVRVFWWNFLVTVLAEFAVIVELSDHLFEPYPAIRGLGRLLVATVAITLFLLYIVPSFGSYPSSRAFLLGFVKKAATVKAAALLVVLAVARRYRLRLGMNTSGMALGFCVYLGANLANFALAERDPARIYEPTFSLIGPLSFTLALVIWTVALWSYQPAATIVEQSGAVEGRPSRRLSHELDQMNTALMRLLRG